MKTLRTEPKMEIARFPNFPSFEAFYTNNAKQMSVKEITISYIKDVECQLTFTPEDILYSNGFENESNMSAILNDILLEQRTPMVDITATTNADEFSEISQESSHLEKLTPFNNLKIEQPVAGLDLGKFYFYMEKFAPSDKKGLTYSNLKNDDTKLLEEALKEYEVEMRRSFPTNPLHYKYIDSFQRKLKEFKTNFDVIDDPERKNYHIAIISAKNPDAKLKISEVLKYLDKHHLVKVYLSDENKKSDIQIAMEANSREYLVKCEPLKAHLKKNYDLVDWGYAKLSTNPNCPLNFLVRRSEETYEKIQSDMRSFIKMVQTDICCVFLSTENEAYNNINLKEFLGEKARDNMVVVYEIPDKLRYETKWSYLLTGRFSDFNLYFYRSMKMPSDLKDLKISFLQIEPTNKKNKGRNISIITAFDELSEIFNRSDTYSL